MKDDKEEKGQSKKFLKPSKGPATVSSSTKSFIKTPNQANGVGTIGAKKLATTLESDEFEMEKRSYGKYDDFDVNIDEDLDEEYTKQKEVSNKYSDDFDESKSQRNPKLKQSNNAYDKEIEYDDELDERDEEMSEQASSSRPSQQSVIQRKPNSMGNSKFKPNLNNYNS